MMPESGPSIAIKQAGSTELRFSARPGGNAGQLQLVSALGVDAMRAAQEQVEMAIKEEEVAQRKIAEGKAFLAKAIPEAGKGRANLHLGTGTSVAAQIEDDSNVEDGSNEAILVDEDPDWCKVSTCLSTLTLDGLIDEDQNM